MDKAGETEKCISVPSYDRAGFIRIICSGLRGGQIQKRIFIALENNMYPGL